MAEWLKAHAWKACVPAMVPQVRILFSPPERKLLRRVRLSSFLFRRKAGFEPGSAGQKRKLALARVTFLAEERSDILFSPLKKETTLAVRYFLETDK